MHTFEEVRQMALARGEEPRRLALAASEDTEALKAVWDVCRDGAARAVLVGDEAKTRALCAEIGFEPAAAEFCDVPEPAGAARKAVALIRAGKADLLMKGHVSTRDYLRAVVDRENGIKNSPLLSVVLVLQAPGFDRFLFFTDTGMVIKPTLQEKVALIENAAGAARKLGVEIPKVAVLCATEMVNESMPDTLDAAMLAQMAGHGQMPGVLVDGPLALDLAVSPRAAEVKGVKGPVAGHADILLVPDIEAGNITVKALRYLGGLSSAATVVGASAPIVISSRSDPSDIKRNSIYLALALS